MLGPATPPIRASWDAAGSRKGVTSPFFLHTQNKTASCKKIKQKSPRGIDSTGKGLWWHYKPAPPGKRQSACKHINSSWCAYRRKPSPLVGAWKCIGREERGSGNARNECRRKQSPAQGTRGWVGGNESRHVLDNYSCILSSSSKMRWCVRQHREEPEALRKLGFVPPRISRGTGAGGGHRKPREVVKMNNPIFVP